MSGARVIGDWGNTRLRLWRLDNGAVAERREGPGIAQVKDSAAALMQALANWDAEAIVLCGMAGARNGLREASYLPCPADAASWASRAITSELAEGLVTIAPGVMSSQANPDVMRGEETQLFGAMALHPALAIGRNCVVLPGTHSKWATLADGRIESFRTFMTGELFDLLRRSSLFAAGGDHAEADVEAGFADGLARRGAATSTLFEARSAQLVGDKSAGWARGFVSGVLIGAEIAEMQPQGAVTIIAEPELAARYSRAFAHQGLDAAILEAEECTIAGLRLLDAKA